MEVVAVAALVQSVFDNFGQQFGIENRYLNAREILDQEHLDIASVATSHKLHAPMMIAACDRRVKAVLCEKPMATSLRECHETMAVAQRNTVKVAIAHQRRFNFSWTDARGLIAEGAISEPRQIQIVCRDGQGLLNVGTTCSI